MIAGRSRLDGTGGERVRVVALLVDPAYDTKTDAHDFAELALARPVAAPSVAVAASAPDAGGSATAVGWGLTAPRGGRISSRLRAADLVLRSDAFCAARYPGDFGADGDLREREAGPPRGDVRG